MTKNQLVQKLVFMINIKLEEEECIHQMILQVI